MRSVVRGTTLRCDRCRQPPRWCVCAGMRAIHSPLQIDVLAHHREHYRPSSTGNLINRVLPESRYHVWRRERKLGPDEIRMPGRELLILHPHGGPLPEETKPDAVQVLLLDGAWAETSMMAREVASWGRLVSLPMAGESRYWLRAQQDGGRFSTAEALMFIFANFGLTEARESLRLQFELHVYASLRARGRMDVAVDFLAGSPIGAAFPELLAQLHTRRPANAAAQ